MTHCQSMPSFSAHSSGPMSKTKIPTTPMATPHTRAWQAFEENLDSIGHMLALSRREAVALETQAARLRTFTGTLSGKSLMTKLGRAKLVRWLNRIVKTLKTSGDRMQTINRWQVVMMVTCIEALPAGRACDGGEA